MIGTTRICLLGGAGFLGSHLAEALAERGEGLLGGPLALEVVDTAFSKLARHEGLRLTCASVRDPGLLEAVVERSDVIVSLTALCNPSLYNTRPLEVIDASFADLLPLVRLCSARGRYLVHFSTCEVYGKNLPGAEDQPMTEEGTPLVLGPIDRERWTYACAKQLLERTIWAHGVHHGLPFAIVRPFNVIGPRMDYLAGVDGEGTPRVLACFMRALLLGEPLQLVDGGARRRAFVDVADFTDGVLRLLARRERCRGQIVNLGNPENDVSVRELAEQMAAVYRARYGGEVRLEEVSAEAFYGSGYDDTERRVPGIEKARRLLDWEPRTSLREMLPPIIEDYHARYAALLEDERRRGGAVAGGAR